MDKKGCCENNIYRVAPCFVSGNNADHWFFIRKEGIGISAYCVIGGLIFSAIISLQVITVQQSNAVHNELIILASQRTNQKITKFCHSSTDHFSSIYVRFMQHRSGSIE